MQISQTFLPEYKAAQSSDCEIALWLNNDDCGIVEFPGNLAATFGRNLRVLREQRNVSHSQLAKDIGCDAAHLGKIEAGRPGCADFEIIVKIKTSLDVTYNDLVGGIG